ncbi:hypothetical protein ACS0TY_000736 [Phlomoides rotata]
MSAPEGMYDVALKPKLLRSLLREYVPDEKHPFSNPSELSYVVSTVKTHKLLSEWTPQPVEEDVVEAWKSAVDSWVNRLLTLASSTLPDKCWAGICLLGLTCQECSSERFLTSYAVWLNTLLLHIQPTVVSHFVKVASCASLSDMFTRLSGYSNAKKDGTSQATRVIQLASKLLNEDSSAVVLEEAVCLLCTMINFFPSSVHRHYDSIETAIVSKLVSGKCSASVLKKLGYGLSLLPKSRGDEESWSLMLDKILLYVNSQLNDAFQGLEEEGRSAQTMRELLPAGKEPPLPLGGSAVSEHTSDLSSRRPERLLGSRSATLLQCCCTMLTSSYPAMVPVPIRGLIALARRVLLVDGSLSLSSYSLTTLKQEFICSEIPLLQLRSLEILQAVAEGLSSQLLPHAAHIVELLKEYLTRCKFPDLKIKAYSILKVLLMSMGVGLAIHVSQDIVSNVFIDLDFLGDEKDGKSSGTNTKVQQDLLIESRHKKRKHSNMAGSFLEQSMRDSSDVETPNTTPVPVRIAALEALEAVLTVGGSIRSESWRGNIDHLLITVATYACKGGLSKEERKIILSGDPTSIWADFQLAALRALLASLLSPGRVRPSHLALGLKLFCRGTQETGTKLAEFCGHALLALEVLIHPRVLPLSDQLSSIDGYKVLSNTFSSYQPGEPESEDDDLNENWPGNDDEMETHATKGQHDAHYSDKPSPTAKDTDKLPSISHVPKETGPKVTSMANIDDHMAVVESPKSVDPESVDQRTRLIDSEAGKGMASTSERHVLGNTDEDSITIMERIYATLSSAEKSKVPMPESEDVDELPDIVDGDPDSE